MGVCSGCLSLSRMFRDDLGLGEDDVTTSSLVKDDLGETD